MKSLFAATAKEIVVIGKWLNGLIKNKALTSAIGNTFKTLQDIGHIWASLELQAGAAAWAGAVATWNGVKKAWDEMEPHGTGQDERRKLYGILRASADSYTGDMG